jgi:hypothetical protein
LAVNGEPLSNRESTPSAAKCRISRDLWQRCIFWQHISSWQRSGIFAAIAIWDWLLFVRSRPRSCINVFHVSTPTNNKHLNPTFSSCEKVDGTTFSRSTVDVCSTASCTRALYGHAITTKVPESMNEIFQTTKCPAYAGVANLPGRCDSNIAYLPFPLLVGCMLNIDVGPPFSISLSIVLQTLP